MTNKYLYSDIAYNDFLGISKEIKAETSLELNRRIREQQTNWREKEEQKRKRRRVGDLKYQIDKDTIEAIRKIDKYKNILKDSLKIDHSIDIDSLKKSSTFKEFEFKEREPNLEEIKMELEVPEKHSTKELFFKSVLKKRIKLENEAKNLFEEMKNAYEKKKEKAKNKYDEEKESFINGMRSFNDSIDEFETDLEKVEAEAVERYVNLVLEKSIYPKELVKQYEVQYNHDKECIIISYDLPRREEVPIITQYKYVEERKEVIDVRMKEKEFNEFYEEFLYRICLKNIYEIFQALNIEGLKKIMFNGWIDDIDRKTGNYFRTCIIWAQASREEFSKLDLENVNAKECFLQLNGTIGNSLCEIGSSKNILDLNKISFRGIHYKKVLDGVESEINPQ